MAVVVARRGGLHVAATRFAAAAPARPRLRRACAAGCWPSRTPSCRRAGQARPTAPPSPRSTPATPAAGAPGEWAGHYQGGPIGFAQREFEIAPDQAGSRWYREPIAAGHAIAWNPSLPGGGKAEDTYLVTDDGQLALVTSAPGWPVEPDDGRQPPRPAVLEVGT